MSHPILGDFDIAAELAQENLQADEERKKSNVNGKPSSVEIKQAKREPKIKPKHASTLVQND